MAPISKAWSVTERAYGPTALLTPANALTAFRIVVAPIFIYLVVTQRVSWFTTVVGLTAPLTDFFDGIVARKQGSTTAGAFLDPLADKIIILGGLYALIWSHDPVRAFIWPALVITLREVWMSYYRSRAAQHGVSIPATSLAKWKTLVQDFAVGLCVLPWTGHHLLIPEIVAWLAVVLTLVTGWQYYRDGRKVGVRAR